MKIHNTHIHVFGEKDVPRGFLPFGLVRIATTRAGFFILKNIMKAIDPIFKNTSFQKYIRYCEIGKKKMENIFLTVVNKYPKDTVFWILTINMENMGAGRVPRTYTEQLKETKRLYEKYPDLIRVFLHVDPRQKDFMYWVKQPFVAGIKLYPPMGYMPDDPRLTKMYEYCNKVGMPVITHCGEDSPTHWKGKKQTLLKLLADNNIDHNPKHSKKKLAAQLCHPQLFAKLAAKYPNINFCLAHWGSHSAWKKYLNDPSDPDNWFVLIKRLIKTIPNLYTDISFTLHEKKYFSVLKVMLEDFEIQQKVLFGSDYYMVQSVAKERKFSFDLRGYLGEKLFKIIAIENPKKFSKSKS